MREEFSEFNDWVLPSKTLFVEQHMASPMAAAHWHDHVELNLLTGGGMTYFFDGRQEHVEAGRLVLFWAAIPHQTIAVTDLAPLICIYLPLTDFLALPIDPSSRQAIMQGAFLRGGEGCAAGLGLVETWLADWQSRSEVRRQLVQEEIKLAVRRLILDQADRSIATDRVGPPVSQAVGHVQRLTEVINARFGEPLTLSALSAFAGVHPATANRAFREVLGLSVMDYLARVRLARAMQQLVETDSAILAIALDSGFGSLSRFYDVFKDRVGVTPRQFRLATRA